MNPQFESPDDEFAEILENCGEAELSLLAQLISLELARLASLRRETESAPEP